MTSDTLTLLLSIVVGLGLLGGVGFGVKALVERRVLSANAKSSDATAAAVVAAAARELVDPLRQELAAERAEHAQGVDMERRKVALVSAELDAVRAELRETRAELRATRQEVIELRREIQALREDNARYRQENFDLRHAAGR